MMSMTGMFVLTSQLSPNRMNFKLLIAATGIECITSAYGLTHWFLPLLLPVVI